ncbi:hypothetical protein MN032_01265 [Agromyces atrinae]|jgi:DNA invertase Pin-like site-specific DNA recombinase|uniref:hypothetical protein n=1 Tax=Agromyces atrinae TaxID=592376 RepID=UPI001F57B68C|nr:hypothetical protein [Agromyces atrinae]MCI2956305.1 hypothetical protein [Agromyces atrinae]
MSIERIQTLAGDAGDEHPYAKLLAIAELRRELDRYEATVVRQARTIGMPWQQIAGGLGVTRQAVHKRYGKA